MEIALRILTIIGSIGLFLFGMKLLSESLQKIAGNGIRHTMAVMTGSPWRRIVSGVAITGAIQSSSAVTVMIVSFVNAGILTLRQAIGLIFGANIGTTATAWLICLFGFGLNIGVIAVPLAGLGFALILMHRENYKATGSMIMGFALLFIGLDILQRTFTDIIQSTMLAEFLSQYATHGYLSMIIMIVVGASITAIVQSSSATITLTLVLCGNGWIPLEAGAAMILGENIGTTITANIAAIIANNNAKRAALSHTIINVVGVIIFAPFLPLIMQGLSHIALPFSLAAFHTLFNVCNTLILMNFVPQIVKLTSKVFPSIEPQSHQHLQVLTSGLLSTCEISITQCENEIANHAKRTLKMFGFMRTLTTATTDDKEFIEIYQRIDKYEQITDRVEQEIIGYLADVSRSDLSRAMVCKVQSMFRVTSHLETIADINLTIAKVIKLKKERGLWFDAQLRSSLISMLDLLEQALYMMIKNIEAPGDVNRYKSDQLEQGINNLYDSLRNEELNSKIEDHDYHHVAGLLFSEIIRECEKMGNSIFSVVTISNNKIK